MPQCWCTQHWSQKWEIIQGISFIDQICFLECPCMLKKSSFYLFFTEINVVCHSQPSSSLVKKCTSHFLDTNDKFTWHQWLIMRRVKSSSSIAFKIFFSICHAIMVMYEKWVKKDQKLHIKFSWLNKLEISKYSRYIMLAVWSYCQLSIIIMAIFAKQLRFQSDSY